MPDIDLTDPTASFDAGDVLVRGGALGVEGKPLAELLAAMGRINIDTGNEVGLTLDADGSLRIGSAAGQHLAFDTDEIQSKATGTDPGVLWLNPHAGLVHVGAYVAPISTVFRVGYAPAAGTTTTEILANFAAANNAGATTWTRLSIGQWATNAGYIEVADQADVKGILRLQPGGGETLIGSGATGRTQINGGSGATMVAGAGRLMIGVSEAGNSHMVFDGSTIQSKAAGGVAGFLLQLNPGGGGVAIEGGHRLDVGSNTGATISNSAGWSCTGFVVRRMGPFVIIKGNIARTGANIAAGGTNATVGTISAEGRGPTGYSGHLGVIDSSASGNSGTCFFYTPSSGIIVMAANPAQISTGATFDVYGVVLAEGIG